MSFKLAEKSIRKLKCFISFQTLLFFFFLQVAKIDPKGSIGFIDRKLGNIPYALKQKDY